MTETELSAAPDPAAPKGDRGDRRRGPKRRPLRPPLLERLWRRATGRGVRAGFALRFYASLVPVMMAANLVVCGIATWALVAQAERQATGAHQRTVATLAAVLATPLYRDQHAEVRRLVEEFPQSASIAAVAVHDAGGHEVVPSLAEGAAGDRVEETPILYDDGAAKVWVGTLGVARVATDLATLALWIAGLTLLVTGSATVAVFWVIIRQTEFRIVRPLKHLARVIADPSSLGRRRRIHQRFEGEFGAVVDAFNAMQDRLEQDETELVSANAKLYRAANTDPLTGLMNRTGFEAAARDLLRQAWHEGCGTVLMFIDLNRFKAINDSFGHAIGDRVLATTGRRIVATAPAVSIVARLSGDEFVVLSLEETIDEERLARSGARLSADMVAAIGAEFEIDGHAFRPGASVGYVSSGMEYDFATLVRRADTAMYAMKKSAASVPVAYTPALERQNERRLRIERALNHCVDRDRFSVLLQPIVSLSTLKPVGAEVLLRLDDPELADIGPGEFIPVAEQCGLMPQIGMISFRKAAEAAVPLMARAGPDFYVAVNISSAQLSAAFPQFIADTIAEFELEAENFVLELSENIGDRDSDGILKELHRTGMKLALDDFGTGHSSLGYIAALNPHMIKIERGFIGEAASGLNGQPPRQRALMNAITALCSELDLPMIAEGIETERELETCRSLGMSHGQGYLFARPLPLNRFLDWMALFDRKPAAAAAPADRAQIRSA